MEMVFGSSTQPNSKMAKMYKPFWSMAPTAQKIGNMKTRIPITNTNNKTSSFLVFTSMIF